MSIQQLLNYFQLDAILGADLESYYDSDYSLKKMATTDYIVDPRYKTHCWALQWHDDKKPRVMSDDDFRVWAPRLDWSRIGLLGHHIQYDSFCLSHHYDLQPKMFFDTLSMARLVMPITVPRNLDSLSKAFGRKGKVKKKALEDIAGVRDLSPKQFKSLSLYAGDDIDDTWFIFKKMLPYVPLEELRVIDLTVKMYTRPTVLINAPKMQAIYENQVKIKEELCKKLKVPREHFTSAQKFAEVLRKHGVEPPTKISKRTGEEALAMSKGDLAFKALLAHPKKKVRELVAARFAVNSNIIETRALKMVERAKLGPQPIYLNHAAAHTKRWSGGDGVNWQNWDKKSGMRQAIEAPPKHGFIIVDQSQIEARLNAYRSGQADKIEVFRQYDKIIGWKVNEKGEKVAVRAGPDVYRVSAAQAFGVPVDKVSPEQRFRGKTQELGLGFQAGGPRYADMLRLYGVHITDEQAVADVAAWRARNHAIVACWKSTEAMAKSAWFGQQSLTDGLVTFEGVGNTGYVHLPGGNSLRYDDLRADEDPRTGRDGMSYLSSYWQLRNGEIRAERTRLWSGLIVENLCQSLARALFAQNMAQIARELPEIHIANCTHDELLLVAPLKRCPALMKQVVKIMSTPPAWAPDLPLGVGAAISTTYDKD